MAKRNTKSTGKKRASEDNQKRASEDNQERASEDKQKRKPPKSGSSDLIRSSKEIFAELTGQTPESVSGMQRNDDGWRITIETVELRRIPNSTDVLASYELDLTEDGDVLGYRRARRYLRNQAEESS